MVYIQIARTCPPISHLMFADDLVIFGPAKNIQLCLDKYCAWSGQEVNLNKSGIHFSKKANLETARDIRATLKVGKIDKDAIYLGIPLSLLDPDTRHTTLTLKKSHQEWKDGNQRCYHMQGEQLLSSQWCRRYHHTLWLQFNYPLLML